MARIGKLLVANRGEIAIRVFRACKELGIGTVAIYSEADREALHVEFADDAYLAGETPPTASYLSVQRILEVAARAGVDAIHPGYGFLAESPGFAEAVVSAGLVWVGPPPQAIRTMGNKVTARRAAAAAGIPSVPGSVGIVRAPEEVAAFARDHGWPVAVKAAHGGGGRGFRVIGSASEAGSAIEVASREAQSAFGSPDLYLERYLAGPRHVEIQVLGDARGNVIHLGERDCSLQRRHQKLLEESPSPAVDQGLRERMGAAAVKLTKSVGYQSAGTVEFLLETTDAGPRFWFLEMNTRLQVEHPVSELITGVDLVREMIRTAAGAPLGFTQNDVKMRGHAIECRINTEDPANDFLPCPGTITAYREPSGPGVRVDSGVVAGSSVPPAYDSLIAKLICHAAEREQAIARTLRALEEFRVEGLPTTIPFHRAVLSSDWFRDGAFTTRTVEADLDCKGLVTQGLLRRGHVTTPARVFTVEVDGKRFAVRIAESAGGPGVRARPATPEDWMRAGHSTAGETITAPMQGTIVKTLVAEGDRVKAGDAILVLEAMKMENLIICHRDGVLKELKVKTGEAVQTGAVLAAVGPPD